MGALLSFLGGSAFRMVWGEVSHLFTAKQEHKFEIDRMKLQNDLDAATHARNLEAIKIQAEQGIKTIQVQAEADVSRIEASAWLEAGRQLAVKSGIQWIDGWNAMIRPGVATWAVVMMSMSEFHIITISIFAESVASASLGMYLADRALSKRGK